MYWQKKYFEFIDLNYKIDHIVFLIFMISIHGAFEKMEERKKFLSYGE